MHFDVAVGFVVISREKHSVLGHSPAGSFYRCRFDRDQLLPDCFLRFVLI